MHLKITATPLAKPRRIAVQGPKSMLRRLDPESIAFACFQHDFDGHATSANSAELFSAPAAR
jgi:hypothetical protein